jgi:glycosyltransferase involved in cell wall biosynthesis
VSADGFSIIIPVLNGGRFLCGAIENALAQDVAPLEIIVVNDGSTDDTEAVASRYLDKIRYLSQPNGGPSSARNSGLRVACGKYVAFLDCDDRWTTGNLRTLRAALETDVDIVIGQIQEQRFDPVGRCWIASRALTFSPTLPSMLARRSTFDRVGLLDEGIRIGEDKDWFYRAREKQMKIRYLHGHTALYHRLHDTNITNAMDAPETYLLDLMRRSLRRRGVFKPKKL